MQYDIIMPYPNMSPPFYSAIISLNHIPWINYGEFIIVMLGIIINSFHPVAPTLTTNVTKYSCMSIPPILCYMYVQKCIQVVHDNASTALIHYN